MRFLITIGILVLIIALYVSSIISSFKVNFGELENVVFTGFNLNSLTLNQTIVTVRLKLIITLTSLFNIVISNLNIKAYKNGLLIAESTPNFAENIKKITLSPNIKNEVYQTFNFHLNAELLGLIRDMKLKQPYSIDYQASFKIFGIPVSKKGTHTK